MAVSGLIIETANSNQSTSPISIQINDTPEIMRRISCLLTDNDLKTCCAKSFTTIDDNKPNPTDTIAVGKKSADAGGFSARRSDHSMLIIATGNR